MSKNHCAPRLLLPILIVVGISYGQAPPPTNLVTIPTAGTIARGTYEVEMVMLDGGGVLGRLGVGFADQFSIGMSYGIQKFIGSADMEFNRPVPEAQIKYRLMDESVKWPALALGLDTQGRGIFSEEELPTLADSLVMTKFERYEIKAIGVYMVLSKSWEVLGSMGSHFGISKNFLEEDDLDDDFNVFFGVDKDFGEQFSVFLEFNAALDDNNYDGDEYLEGLDEITFGQGSGYLNAGLRWNVAPAFYLELDINDVMQNRGKVTHYTRELKVVYNDYF